MSWRKVSETIVILGEQPSFSLAELAEASRLERGLVQELAEMGLLDPVSQDATPEDWVFPSRCLDMLRSAARLRETFDLNTGGLALALTYAERVRRLENELNRLRCLLGE